MNRLKFEKSPYLLQHKNNPIDWYAWSDEAFRAAKEQNKPIFLSIGYSTCYWCHMMEKDSFEIQEVADALNKNFISIKVDREEHPDVDKIYMDAVVGMTGSGGWPMSVFLTPDLKPFFGGTFFWREPFLKLITNIAELWKKNPEKILKSGEELTAFLIQKRGEEKSTSLDENLLHKAFDAWHANFDSQYGGFGGAPKFPHSMALSALLRIHRRLKNKEALQMVTQTLDAMAHGGIYDRIGGGFHRYSTQANWSEPHYEKMLYDNALLATAYLEAFQATQKKIYATITDETLHYVLRDMTSPEGGFYSAEDAGEVDREGEFYRLSKEERAKSKRPSRDDKILTAWNGLMIAALAKGYQILNNPVYLQAAQKGARFIKKNLFKNGELLRRYCGGDSRFAGTLDDYAFLIHGLLTLHEADADSEWLAWSKALQTKQDEIFWHENSKEGGYFFSNSQETTLIVHKKEFHDGATPSGNAVAALNLLQFFQQTREKAYLDKAEKILQSAAKELAQSPTAYAQTLIALDYFLDSSRFVCNDETCKR